ncbi:hypothetical protein Tco_0583363 [Tanacetum coccineum]
MLVLIGSRIQIEDKGSINRPLNPDLWFCFVSSGLMQFGSASEVFSSASDLQFLMEYIGQVEKVLRSGPGHGDFESV